MVKLSINKTPGQKKINIKTKEDKSKLSSKSDALKNEREKKIKEVQDKLYRDSIKTLNASRIDLDFDIEEQERFKKQKTKKLITNWSIAGGVIILGLSMFIFGLKNAFFTKNYTGQEIAYLSNYYNNKTNFPEAGVYGFIKQNAQELMKDNMSLYNNIANQDVGITVKDPTVVAVSPNSDTEAVVLFQATLETTAGDQLVDCSVTVDWNGKKYGTLGQVSIYPRELTTKLSKPGKDPYEFENGSDVDTKNIEEAKIFLNSFFEMYYKGQDITPFYNGRTKLQTPEGIEYGGIENFVLMSKPNAKGYNAKANIILRLKNGVEYNTLKYISIKKEGKAWQIDKLY